MAKINKHEPRIDAVSRTAQNIIKNGHFASDDIKKHLSTLHDHWNHLKEKANQSKQDLGDSLQARQYSANASETESWMKEKEPLAGNDDYVNDMQKTSTLMFMTCRRSANGDEQCVLMLKKDEVNFSLSYPQILLVMVGHENE